MTWFLSFPLSVFALSTFGCSLIGFSVGGSQCGMSFVDAGLEFDGTGFLDEMPD